MGIKPKSSTSKQHLSTTAVGYCTECKRGIYSDQPYVRVRRPTIGLNHAECVPAGAVIA